MKSICLAILTIALLAGCVQNQNLYSWGHYSNTLYQMKKNPCDETRLAHTTELKGIIDSSQENKMRVPPGVYCEYGYLLMIQGQKDDGLRFFALEKETYPESAPFIKNLILYLAKIEQKPREQPLTDPVVPEQPATNSVLPTDPVTVAPTQPVTNSVVPTQPVTVTTAQPVTAIVIPTQPDGGTVK